MSTPTVERQPAKVTTLGLRRKKAAGQRITMLTAYDYPTALALDQAGIDSILVGDSLGMVVLGYENTLPVTVEEMLHHCRAVARGARRPLLIGDMPFMSYQVSPEEAVRNAGRFLQQGGMDAVKVEGGRERLQAIEAILLAGIPVMGHIGLTPQSVHQLGGFRPQVKRASRSVDQKGEFGWVKTSGEHHSIDVIGHSGMQQIQNLARHVVNVLAQWLGNLVLKLMQCSVAVDFQRAIEIVVLVYVVKN